MGIMYEVGYWEGVIDENILCYFVFMYGIVKNVLCEVILMFVKEYDVIV